MENQPREKEPRLMDVAVTDGPTALNVAFSFLALAQKRGCFSIEEAAKIHECFKVFAPKNEEES
jgi:hypothetical protein